MAEINMVSCCTCGYEWRQGQDGSHSCAWHMAKTIERQAAEIEQLRDALYSIDRQLGHDDADDALRDEITAAPEGKS